MKALSWKQPFGTLMLHGKIETRLWPTRYRGPVLICASKNPYSVAEASRIMGHIQQDRAWDATGPMQEKDFWMGHAIAVGDLIDCRPMTPQDEDDAFVLYRPGLWCHVYENVRAIVPMPWKGGQKWRNVPAEVQNSIRFKPGRP